MALTARRIRWGLIGLVVIGGLLVPVGAESLPEYLPTRVVMLVSLLVSFGAFQLVSFQWSVLPGLAILLFGSSVTQVFAGEVVPLLWWFTGLVLWALSAPELLSLSTKRLKTLAQRYPWLGDVPRSQIVKFHAPVWAAAAVIITAYTVLLPIVVLGHTLRQALTVALLGAIAGCVLAIVTGRWRVYAVYVVSAFIAIFFLDQEHYATFLGFSWLVAYLVACVIRDPTTLQRSLEDVRKTTKTILTTA